MQTISIPEIDGSHSSSFPAFITDVVVCDLIAPEIADGGRAVFAETDVDEEVGEGVARAEGGVWGFAPAFDVGSEVWGCVPTA
jgi:hypothetical protein